ncbi:lymphatic vessel endothelial hyaluronic receptor 1b [Tautogolabrus adspersus]
MARLLVFTLSLFWFFAAFSLAPDSSLNKAAGVFLLIEGGVYTFNFTAARDACLFLNVTMATRAQMERAVQHGLETCKFGWITERVAVVPRLTSDEKCGRGKTGVVQWNASEDTKFGVFCFIASDDMSTSSPQSFTSSTTQTAVTPTSTPASPGLTLTTKSPPSRELITTKASGLTSFTPAVHVNTTRSDRITSIPTSHKPFSTHVPTSPSRLVTSKPTLLSYAFSTSDHASDISSTSESGTKPTIDSVKPSLGDVPTALIILGVIVLLLTAAGVVWYLKLNIFTLWCQTQQKDDIETEMWKHSSCEMDLHSLHDGEEEESDRKYSSDITLCVNPDTKTNSSE